MKPFNFFFLAAALCAASVSAQTNRTVFPAEFANTPGNIQEDVFGSATDYQELFRASSLAEKWSTPVQITAIAFRVGEGGPDQFNAVVPHLEVRMSTTSRAPEQMARDYASNKGADEKIVFNKNNVRILATGNQAINPFEVRFEFDEPFIYDPTKGHLLFHLTFEGLVLGDRSLDAHTFGGPASEWPLASYGSGAFVVPTGFGSIPEFTWVAIPEPGSGAMLFLGLIGVALRDRRRMGNCRQDDARYRLSR